MPAGSTRPSLRAAPIVVVPVIGITQILAYGSSYYLLAVLAPAIAAGTGWPLSAIVGGLSLGLLVAGLAAPKVGRLIHAKGGRQVLAASAALLAAGLLGLALAPGLPSYFCAWALVGLGMGAGLYDPAFSTLGRLYGERARRHITAVTLFGGFASTLCWPLSAWLLSEFGWRGACAFYAAIQLLVSLPLYLFALPRGRPPGMLEDPGLARGPVAAPARPPTACPGSGVFRLLAISIMTGSLVSSVMSVHLLAILQARDFSLGVAVALGALVGPSQVGARFIEMLAGKYHHPIWTKVASVSCVAIGLVALWGELPFVEVALVFYGAGIGLESIARATLPLVLFGAADYALVMGRLARPSLIAQAAAPPLAALLVEMLGSESMLGIVALVASLNVVLALLLLALTWRRNPNTMASA